MVFEQIKYTILTTSRSYFVDADKACEVQKAVLAKAPLIEIALAEPSGGEANVSLEIRDIVAIIRHDPPHRLAVPGASDDRVILLDQYRARHTSA